MSAIHKVTSELMLDYVRQVERLLGRRLKPDEARRITPQALEYARMIREWIPKEKLEKLEKKGQRHANDRQ
jgi:hypothetical protein